jgi:hypothetical protein
MDIAKALMNNSEDIMSGDPIGSTTRIIVIPIMEAHHLHREIDRIKNSCRSRQILLEIYEN